MKNVIFKSENKERLKLLVLDEEIIKDGNKYYFIANSYCDHVVTEMHMNFNRTFDMDYKNADCETIESSKSFVKEYNCIKEIICRLKKLFGKMYESYKYSYLVRSLLRFLIYLELMHTIPMNAFHKRKYEILTDINNFIIRLKNNNLLETYKNFNFGSFARLHNIDIGIYLKK